MGAVEAALQSLHHNRSSKRKRRRHKNAKWKYANEIGHKWIKTSRRHNKRAGLEWVGGGGVGWEEGRQAAAEGRRTGAELSPKLLSGSTKRNGRRCNE